MWADAHKMGNDELARQKTARITAVMDMELGLAPTATSMSVALLYGFSNPDKNNAYTFIDIIVVKTDDVVARIHRINEQIKSRVHQMNGHYHLIHNRNLDLEG